MPDERVMIFVDGSNLYHALKSDHHRTDLDFVKFANALAAGRRLIRVYYYNAPVDNTKEPDRARSQQSFFARVRNLPRFELRLGRLLYRDWPNTGPFEKGVDVKLATDMMAHACRANCDVAVLVSGDTDFFDALQGVKDAGISVEVALLGGPRSSQKLRDVADIVIDVDTAFLSSCWR